MKFISRSYTLSTHLLSMNEAHPVDSGHEQDYYSVKSIGRRLSKSADSSAIDMLMSLLVIGSTKFEDSKILMKWLR